MKQCIAILLVFSAFSMRAAASDISHRSFLRDFDSKIKSLENYSVTYNEAGKAKASQNQKNVGTGLTVKLVPVKR